VPRFAKVFASLHRDLPTPTKILLALQSAISHYGWLMALVVVGLVLAFRAWDKTESGGLFLDRLRMRVPLLGPLGHKEAVSSFCRTMATLVEGGVPILTSFEVAERAVGNRVLRLAITQVRAAVQEGENLAGPLRRSGVFPSLVTNMIAVGEETGSLQEMLNRVSDAYDAEVANKMRQLISLVEPGVILIMGGIIGTIVISMLVPVLELSTGLK
jgi:type IV pilus assembly protein PilC